MRGGISPESDRPGQSFRFAMEPADISLIHLPARINRYSGYHSSIKRVAVVLTVVMATLAATATYTWAQSLRGSQTSLDRQNTQAMRHDFTYLRDPKQLNRFVNAGLLVPVRENPNFRLKDVSFPYTRREIGLFLVRLSRQYRAACGEQLVVTSLTRPLANQPRNASDRSVHPTGMALDLRRPINRTCRIWLEDTLLYLEGRGVLEATRERRPPHYHIAIYPQEYAAYVASRNSRRARASEGVRHIVRRRDSLWRISHRYGTTVRAIQRANDLASSVIHPGQALRIPVTGGSAN